MNPSVALLAGVVCAGIGGELFVRGLIGVARWARVSTGVIGTTLAAFATSSPELSVAVGAAVSGRPEISLGDALGSNVVNVALILAGALCISRIISPRTSVRRDFPVAALVPVVVGLLGLDGLLSRLDGAALLALFFGWLSVVVRDAKRERSAAAVALGELQPGRASGQLLAGLALLIGAGRLIVIGARGIAEAFGIPEFVIGATVVALGTSVPELATTAISKLRKHDEIGLGTILGSNIFNGLLIIGMVSAICPIRVEILGVGLALGFGVLTTLVTFPRSNGIIESGRGMLLLGLYAAYLIMLLWE